MEAHCLAQSCLAFLPQHSNRCDKGEETQRECRESRCSELQLCKYLQSRPCPTSVSLLLPPPERTGVRNQEVLAIYGQGTDPYPPAWRRRMFLSSHLAFSQ